jgi:hypothetical protein
MSNDENEPQHPSASSYEYYLNFFRTAGYDEEKARWLADGEYDEAKHQADVRAWDDWTAKRLLVSPEEIVEPPKADHQSLWGPFYGLAPETTPGTPMQSTIAEWNATRPETADEKMARFLLRLENENVALREIAQAVVSIRPLRNRWQWGRYAQCPFFCSGEVEVSSVNTFDWPSDVEHAVDCPVTKARDLLSS